MPLIKISDAYPSGEDWNAATVRSFVADQNSLFIDTIQELRDNDLEQARWAFVKENGAFYRLDLASSASDDGDAVLRDNVGRRYLKASTAVISPDGSAPRMVRLTQEAFDELDPPDAATLYFIREDA